MSVEGGETRSIAQVWCLLLSLDVSENCLLAFGSIALLPLLHSSVSCHCKLCVTSGLRSHVWYKTTCYSDTWVPSDKVKAKRSIKIDERYSCK